MLFFPVFAVHQLRLLTSPTPAAARLLHFCRRLPRSCRGCEKLLSIGSLRATLLSRAEPRDTSTSQIVENTSTLSPFLATHTDFAPVSPVFATHTKTTGVVLVFLAKNLQEQVEGASHSETARSSSTFQRISELSPFVSHSSELFCTHAKLNAFLFKQFRTLSQKHPGGGVHPSSQKLFSPFAQFPLPLLTSLLPYFPTSLPPDPACFVRPEKCTVIRLGDA